MAINLRGESPPCLLSFRIFNHYTFEKRRTKNVSIIGNKTSSNYTNTTLAGYTGGDHGIANEMIICMVKEQMRKLIWFLNPKNSKSRALQRLYLTSYVIISLVYNDEECTSIPCNFWCSLMMIRIVYYCFVFASFLKYSDSKS